MTTVDHYAAAENLTEITVLKVDVEGFERQVLQGAVGLFVGSHAPRQVHIEARGPANARWVARFMAERKYRRAWSDTHDYAFVRSEGPRQA